MTKQKNFECKIIDPSQHRELLISLFEEAFGEKVSLEQFVWKYENNPLGKMKVWSVWDVDTGTLVGSYGAFKRYFIEDGDSVIAYQRADSMVKPSYRRMGIFTKMLKEMNKDLFDEGVLFQFGYSNDKSASGIRKFDNSKELYHSNVYVYVNGSENIINSYLKINGKFSKILIGVGTPVIRLYNWLNGYYRKNDVSLESLSSFNDLPEKWSYEAAKKYRFFPLRSKEFLQWKVINIPGKFKKNVLPFWMVRNGEKIGYCVLYKDRARNVLKIIDILCEDIEQNMRDCIIAVRYFAILNKYDAIITNVASGLYRESLKKSGFIQSKRIRCTFFPLQSDLDIKSSEEDSFWLQLPIDRDSFGY